MNPTLGGVQRVTDTIARYFVRQGHNIHYLTFEYDERDQYKFPGMIHRLPGIDFFSESNIAFYHKLIKDLGIEVVINNDAANERSRLFLNTGQHKVIKLSVYHTDPLHELYHPVDISKYVRNRLTKIIVSPLFKRLVLWNRYTKKRRQIKWLIKNNTRLLFISDAHKAKVNEVMNIDSKAISVIYNPSAYSDEFSRTDFKKTVLFVGRIDIPVKRPDILLQIWKRLEEDFQDWRLLFLGDGPGMKTVRDLNNKLGLKNTEFLGYADPEKYYQEASIICMTSEYEGFPSVLIEAMNFGVVPVAFNNWSSLSEVIIDRQTGMSADRGDIEQYIEKMRMLMSDPQKLKAISEKAISHVERYNIEKIGPEWDNLLKELSRK